MPSFGVIFVLELTNFGLFSLLFSALNTGRVFQKAEREIFSVEAIGSEKIGKFHFRSTSKSVETCFFTAAVVVVSRIGKV